MKKNNKMKTLVKSKSNSSGNEFSPFFSVLSERSYRFARAALGIVGDETGYIPRVVN
jgi:hypothetical protein